MDFDKIYQDTIEEINEAYKSETPGSKMVKNVSFTATEVTIRMLKKYHDELQKKPH